MIKNGIIIKIQILVLTECPICNKINSDIVANVPFNQCILCEQCENIYEIKLTDYINL